MQAATNAGVTGSVTLTGAGDPGATGQPASTWTFIVAGVAMLFLLGVYFGLGGFRGGVSS